MLSVRSVPMTLKTSLNMYLFACHALHGCVVGVLMRIIEYLQRGRFQSFRNLYGC
jgi:hypothetical protein